MYAPSQAKEMYAPSQVKEMYAPSQVKEMYAPSAADPGFENRGGAAENFRKLTCTFNGWYKKNRGGARLLRPPLDPPLPVASPLM